ncbi:MAG TPA: glycine betaine ABC transporter substrate-binding protein [Bryobacteraceae bacterium]|nr:glycine betaine ABC transporter substrate-binding protein [Bryobacteraceae bacterium]
MDRAKTVACLSALLLASCGGQRTIVVGSKNFTEQVILGEILAQQIERQMHVPVERYLNLGGTLLVHEALVRGSIDLYPEYTGTALTAVLKRAPEKDSAAVLNQVREAYRKRWKLDWLSPLGFNNTFAMIVRGEKARSEHLATLSDAAQAQAWRLGVGAEFQNRADGLPGLMKAYDLRLDGQPVTMDLGLLYTALDGRKVDMIAANSTDGQAAVRDVAILRDDRHYFPPYDCAVVAREETLERYPALRAAMEQLSGRLTTETMRRLNQQVEGLHRPVPQVAREFLNSLAVR